MTVQETNLDLGGIFHFTVTAEGSALIVYQSKFHYHSHNLFLEAGTVAHLLLCRLTPLTAALHRDDRRRTSEPHPSESLRLTEQIISEQLPMYFSVCTSSLSLLTSRGVITIFSDHGT